MRTNRGHKLAFVLVFFFFLTFPSCNRSEGEVDCDSYIQSSFGPHNCAHCTIKGSDWLFLDFRATDTVYFSYNGHDTLKYEIRDSLDIIDTVKYVGQGKQNSISYGNAGSVLSQNCLEILEERKMKISFKPLKMGYSDLDFSLTAGYGSSQFEYIYNSNIFSGAAFDIDNSQITTYMPVFTFKGKEFYNVIEYTKVAPGGGYKYYVNKYDQLILIQKNDSSHLFRIYP